MGAFDDLLSQGAPEPEVHIFLPNKLGTADKGGDATQAAVAAAGKPADAQSPTSTSGPDPEPQLPEGSDPDEPDTAEDDAADAAAVAAAAREMFSKPQPVAESATDPGEEYDEPHGEDEDESADDQRPEGHARAVANRKGSGLSFEGEHSHLKQFPKALIEILREILKARIGDVATRELSQNTVVTAFVVAALSVEFAADDNTLEAVKAFKEADPRTDAIEKRTALLLEQQTKSDGMLKGLLKRLGEVVETAAVLEMGQAYALAERTAQLDTSGTVPENIDVTQKRAVAARDNIRTLVKKQRQDEKIRDGRPIR